MHILKVWIKRLLQKINRDDDDDYDHNNNNDDDDGDDTISFHGVPYVKA
jgi:hypothetical protein